MALGQTVQVAGRQQELRIFEYEGDALSFGRILQEVSLDKRIQPQQNFFRLARPGGWFAPPPDQVLRHGAQPLRVRAGERPQAAAQIVAEHNIPAAEHLRRQKLAQAAVAVLVGIGQSHQIVHISVQHEHARCAREIKIRELACPCRIPFRQRAGRPRRRGNFLFAVQNG